jgi:hypothetical protein
MNKSRLLGAVVSSSTSLQARNKTTGAGFVLAVGEWDIFIEGVWL